MFKNLLFIRFRYLFCFVSLLSLNIPNQATGQIFEDFSGAEFNSSGLWTGDLSNFTVSNGQGRLNAVVAGSSYFSSPIVWQDSFVFSFYVKLNFAPSTQNKISIYLWNNQADLNGGSGLMMNIGKNGDDDGVTLVYGNQTSSTTISESGSGEFASGVDGIFSGIITEERLYIQYKKVGQTSSVLYDGPKPDAFMLDQSAYFGFLMKYSSGNIKNFFFDDIEIDRYKADTVGPVVVSVVPTGQSSVRLIVNEEIVEEDFRNPENYKMYDSFGRELTIQHVATSGLTADITITETFKPDVYFLTISGLHDLAGNLMNKQTLKFNYFAYATPERYDVLINELMADPSPVVTLPESEYIELWNTSSKILLISQLKIVKGITFYDLPKRALAPDEYLIIVPSGDVDKWNGYNNVVGISPFPTLNNDGAMLTLIDSAGNLIHHVSYDLSSYKDNSKKDGGWSLEHTVKEGICDGNDVWRASTDASGGTPGRVNSNTVIASENVLLTGMELLDDRNLQLCFSKYLNFSDSVTQAAFSSVNTPSFQIFFSQEVDNCCIIEFEESLMDAVWYELGISGSIVNCLGNYIEADTLIGFGWGFPKPGPNDIIINEILFDPNTGGSDFVEFYNRTSTTFDLRGLNIVNTQGNKISTINKTALLKPNDYLAFCPDKNWLAANYTLRNPQNIIEIGIPSFNSDQGNVSLMDGISLIDSFRYNQKLHNVFLTKVKGVSLERVSADGDSNQKSNWQSAASDAGGATPGYVNSQTRTLKNVDKILTKPEDHFSPNNDGFLDQFIVQYLLDKPGYILRWRVFDAAGRLIKSDQSGVLTGTDGFITWDGSTDDLKKALPGIYVFKFQFTHPDGTTKSEHISCVLTY